MFAEGVSANERDREAARRVAMAPISRALSHVADAEKEAASELALPARLLIVVDQLDEIFAANVADESRVAFARLVEALAWTGEVWIVATLRAESFGTFLESPLARLLQSKGRHPSESDRPDVAERVFNLMPPSVAEMGEVLRGPAAAAGLEWEMDPVSGQKLDAEILAGVDRSDLLPLLQFVLQQLFEQRATVGPTAMLTWAAYRRIGSLDGAIDTAARRALDGVGEPDRRALPRLLRALVAAGSGGDSQPILRRAPLAEVERDPHAKLLARALTDARILVTARGENGETIIALAHQRVIEAWGAARTIIAENRALLRIREDIETACEAWIAGGRRPDRLIPAGSRLFDAESAVAALKDELSPEQREFVARSGRAARFRQRLIAAAAMVFFVTALAAAASAYFFFDARNRAERNFVSAKQAIFGLDDFIWSANQGAQAMAGVKLAVVEASLGQIRRTLDDLSAEAPDDLDLLAVRAANFANFVDAYLTASSLKDASAAADEGVATADHMARLAAADPRTLKAQIMAAYKRADVRKPALDLKDGIADCRNAERLAETLVAKSGSDAAALRLQWVATEKLGEALLAAHDQEARPALEKATGLARTLLSAAASDPARRRDLALSLASEGRAALALGDVATALARFADYLDAARKLVADHPSDPLFARDEALALISLGGAKFANGDRSGASSDLSAAVEIARRLANADPLNARAKHDLLAALAARAQTELDSDKAAARADLDEAVKIARDFAALDGGSARSRFDLATVLMRLALNFDDAKPLADQARTTIASLSAEGLITPAEQATVAQFEQLMKLQ
jgi:hypothetical protein